MQTFADNIAILASTYGKFSSHKGIFKLLPSHKSLHSTEATKQYLQQALSQFAQFTNDRKLSLEITTHEIQDHEVDLFQGSYFSYICFLDGEKGRQAINLLGSLTQQQQNKLVTPQLSEDPAIYVAAERGNLGLTTTLLKLKADPNIVGTSTQQTPLFIAADNGYSQVVQALVDAKADLNHASIYGETALIRAAGRCNEEVARVLIKAGADTTLRTNEGGDALVFATNVRCQKVIEMLLTAGAQFKDYVLEEEFYSYANEINNKIIIKSMVDTCLRTPSKSYCESDMRSYNNLAGILDEELTTNDYKL